MTRTLARLLLSFWIGMGLSSIAVSAEISSPQGTLTLEKAPSGEGVLLTLPSLDQGFAAFLRQGYFWLVLPSSLSVTQKLKQLPPGFSKPERLTAKGGTLFRFQVPKEVFPVITKNNHQTTLLLTTRSQKNTLPSHVISPHILTVESDGKSAFLNAPQSTLCEFMDPVTHRTLFIIFGEGIEGAFPTRVFKRDFSLIPTLQGIAIEALPYVTIRKTEKNFYLSKIGGLHLSPRTDTAFSHKNDNSLKAILTPLNPQRITTLQHLIPQAKGRQRLALEWELIRQQLMDEQATEALARLEGLAKKYPYWENLQSFQLLRGISLFLKNQLASAFQTFSNPFCGPHTRPWLLATRLKNGEIKEGLELLETHLEEMKALPQPFQGNLLLLAVQASIQADMPKLALKLLRSLPTSLMLEQKKYADSLSKQLIFEPLLPGPPSQSEIPELTKPYPYLRHEANVQTRLETLLVAHKVGRMNDQKLIERLETIKWESKSSTFDSQILKLLGTLYDRVNSHLKSLDYYRSFLRRYPRDPEYKAIQRQAILSYHDAILDQKLPFVRKLALFRSFPEFLKQAPEKEQLVQTMATEMIQHNLPDEAAALIAQECANAVTPALLLQLAETHVLNKHPERALALLRRFADKFSSDHQNALNQIKSKALTQEKRYDQALTLIPNDHDKTHCLQRAALFIKKSDWNAAANELQKLLKETENDPEILERLAICLYQSKRFEDLRHLFTPTYLTQSPFLKALSLMLPRKKPKTLEEGRAFLNTLPADLVL